jgi:hypothetical protein
VCPELIVVDKVVGVEGKLDELTRSNPPETVPEAMGLQPPPLVSEKP